MINAKASNWVDRGEPPEATLTRVLSSYLELEPSTNEAQLREYAAAVRGMAEADATEVNIAGYLRTLESTHLAVEHPARHRRAAAIGSGTSSRPLRPGTEPFGSWPSMLRVLTQPRYRYPRGLPSGSSETILAPAASPKPRVGRLQRVQRADASHRERLIVLCTSTPTRKLG
jgi:hypothetical protein